MINKKKIIVFLGQYDDFMSLKRVINRISPVELVTCVTFCILKSVKINFVDYRSIG